MAQPPRHGQRWERQAPTAAARIDAPPTISGKATPIGVEPEEGSTPTVGALPVRVLDAFLQELPAQQIQFLTYSGQARITSTNLVANGSIQLGSLTVPSQNIAFVITDVQFYGLAPSKYLEAPPIPINAIALIGMVRFELTVGGRQPIRGFNDTVNPQGASSGSSTPASGWPLLNTSPAPDRGSFVLYAKSNQEIAAWARVDVVPRMWLTELGVRLTGYSLPEIALVNAIKRAAAR